jgi:hypothetical protein
VLCVGAARSGAGRAEGDGYKSMCLNVNIVLGSPV